MCYRLCSIVSPFLYVIFYVMYSKREQITCTHTWAIGCVEMTGEERTFGIEDKTFSKLRVRTLNCLLLWLISMKKILKFLLLFPTSVSFLEIFYPAPRKISPVMALNEGFWGRVSCSVGISSWLASLGYNANMLNFSLLIILVKVFGSREKKTCFDLINRKAINRGNDAAQTIYGKV